MIEVNLLPSAKREQLVLQRARNRVIALAGASIAISTGLLLLACVYVFGVQQYLLASATSDITRAHQEFTKQPDVAKMVTINNQLAQIDKAHATKQMNSRIFSLLGAISLKNTPSSVAITAFSIDGQQKTMTLSVQTERAGFEAADVFKKNLAATRFYFIPAKNDAVPSELQTPPVTRAPGEENELLARDITLRDLAYVDADSGGAKAVSFKVSFTYDERFLSQQYDVLRVRGLGSGNVTDSHQRLPEELFKPAGRRNT